MAVVDVGNQRTKWAIASSLAQTLPDFELTETKSFSDVGEIQVDTALSQRIWWRVSSVNAKRLSEFKLWLASNRPGDHVTVIQNSMIPIVCKTKHPERVGTDRLLGSWAAIRMQEPKVPLIVIDAGTAVTIDVVDQNEVFLGGVIFPGIEASLRQLNETAAQLPKYSFDSFPMEVIGETTESAIHCGVFQMQAGAIRFIVQRIQKQLGPHRVVMTGGGIRLMRNVLPESWHFVDNLVLRGIGFLPESALATDRQ